MSDKNQKIVVVCGAGFTKALFPDIAPLGNSIHIIGHQFVQNLSRHLLRKLFKDKEKYRSFKKCLGDFMEEHDPALDLKTAEVSERILNNPGSNCGDVEKLLLMIVMGAQFLHNSLSQQLMLSNSPARRFVRFLDNLADRKDRNNLTFVTTNYDQVLDNLLFDEINPPCSKFEKENSENNDWKKCKKRYAYGDIMNDQKTKCLEENCEKNNLNIVDLNCQNHENEYYQLIKLNGSVNWLSRKKEKNNEKQGTIYLPLGQDVLFRALQPLIGNDQNDNKYIPRIIPPLPEDPKKNCVKKIREIRKKFLDVQSDNNGEDSKISDDLIEEAIGKVETADTVLFIGQSLRDGADSIWRKKLQKVWNGDNESNNSDGKKKTFIFVMKDSDGEEEDRLRDWFSESDAPDERVLHVLSNGLDGFLPDYENDRVYQALGLESILMRQDETPE